MFSKLNLILIVFIFDPKMIYFLLTHWAKTYSTFCVFFVHLVTLVGFGLLNKRPTKNCLNKMSLCYITAKYWIQLFYQLVFFQLAQVCISFWNWLIIGLTDLNSPQFLSEYCQNNIQIKFFHSKTEVCKHRSMWPIISKSQKEIQTCGNWKKVWTRQKDWIQDLVNIAYNGRFISKF